jgi:hypothetical protein
MEADGRNQGMIMTEEQVLFLKQLVIRAMVFCVFVVMQDLLVEAWHPSREKRGKDYWKRGKGELLF